MLEKEIRLSSVTKCVNYVMSPIQSHTHTRAPYFLYSPSSLPLPLLFSSEYTTFPSSLKRETRTSKIIFKQHLYTKTRKKKKQHTCLECIFKW